ncbi:MAG: hypothetical protein R2780_03375 [Crocinitomicaceae bacterium]
MRLNLLMLGLLINGSVFAQLPNTAQPQMVPLSEITHEKVNGKIIMADGTIHEGILTYNEWGDDKNVYFFGADGNGEKVTIEDHELIQSLTIDGRGTFMPILLSETATRKRLALFEFDGEGYDRYKSLVAAPGIAGYKIQGGQIEGHYVYHIHHERVNKYYRAEEVKAIEKNITNYIDYCSEITDKVAKKEKGFKPTLLSPDWRVLEKAISESEKTCPK